MEWMFSPCEIISTKKEISFKTTSIALLAHTLSRFLDFLAKQKKIFLGENLLKLKVQGHSCHSASIFISFLELLISHKP